jgi:hypothetical protein
VGRAVAAEAGESFEEAVAADATLPEFESEFEDGVGDEDAEKSLVGRGAGF